VSRVDDAGIKRIDDLLGAWRQGDCVVGEQWFFFRLDVAVPLTEDAVTAAEEEVDIGEAEVRGFMVATQTCDIVRTCAERPFVEVCPLVEVDVRKLGEIKRAARPNYAFVPALEDQRMVADLDRVMTVEKAVLTRWARTPGTRDDDDARRVAQALARKRARPAFPDDFSTLVSKLREHMSGKHDKNSPEGEALRRLREIRVRAAPSWEAREVEITLWFIRGEDEGEEVDEAFLAKWLALVPSGGRFKVDGVIQRLEDMTAREYVESDPLDLDHLSTRAG
jgi:hypothetical protein